MNALLSHSRGGRIAACVALMLACALAPLTAIDSAKGPIKGATVIESDRLVYDQPNGKSEFTGSVKVTGENFLMTSREMQVYYNKAHQIERMVSTGDVAIRYFDRRSHSGQAEYFVADKRLVLTKDSPEVWDGNRTHTRGDAITIFLATNRIDAVGHTSTEQLPDPAAVTPTPSLSQ